MHKRRDCYQKRKYYGNERECLVKKGEGFEKKFSKFVKSNVHELVACCKAYYKVESFWENRILRFVNKLLWLVLKFALVIFFVFKFLVKHGYWA